MIFSSVSIPALFLSSFFKEGVRHSLNSNLQKKITGVVFLALGSLALAYLTYRFCIKFQNVKVVEKVDLVKKQPEGPEKAPPLKEEPKILELDVKELCWEYLELGFEEKYVKNAFHLFEYAKQNNIESLKNDCKGYFKREFLKETNLGIIVSRFQIIKTEPELVEAIFQEVIRRWDENRATQQEKEHNRMILLSIYNQLENEQIIFDCVLKFLEGIHHSNWNVKTQFEQIFGQLLPEKLPLWTHLILTKADNPGELFKGFLSLKLTQDQLTLFASLIGKECTSKQIPHLLPAFANIAHDLTRQRFGNQFLIEILESQDDEKIQKAFAAYWTCWNAFEYVPDDVDIVMYPSNMMPPGCLYEILPHIKSEKVLKIVYQSLPDTINEWQKEHIERALREGKTYDRRLNFKVYRIDLNQEVIDSVIIVSDDLRRA